MAYPFPPRQTLCHLRLRQHPHPKTENKRKIGRQTLRAHNGVAGRLRIKGREMGRLSNRVRCALRVYDPHAKTMGDATGITVLPWYAHHYSGGHRDRYRVSLVGLLQRHQGQSDVRCGRLYKPPGKLENGICSAAVGRSACGQLIQCWSFDRSSLTLILNRIYPGPNHSWHKICGVLRGMYATGYCSVA